MKEKWWKDRANEIQDFADKQDTHRLFDAIRKIHGPTVNTTQAVKSEDGDTLFTEKDDINRRWTEHFSKLLNLPSTVDESVLDSLPRYSTNQNLLKPPTLEEVEIAIAKTGNRKAPGEDGIPAEIFKHGGDAIIKKLHQIFLQVWACEKVPTDWRDAIFVTIFKKKGDSTVCGNYRGISLLSVAGKIFAKLLLNRINDTVEKILPEAQCGFRKSRSTADMIFAARQIQEKCLEKDKDLYMVFIDLTKAYDTVSRDLLWQLLKRYGIPDKIINILESFHSGMEGKVSRQGEILEPFKINNGLRQGCVLAPVLFNIFFTAVFAAAFQELGEGIPIRYKLNDRIFDSRNLQSKTAVFKTFIRELLYADDCALIAHSQQELQDMLSRFSSAVSKFGLTISLKKTEVVFQRSSKSRNTPDPEIKIGDTTLAIKEDFVYLGNSLANDTTLDTEITRRIQKASKAFGMLWTRLWSSEDISTGTKIAVYRAVVLSTLLYGCQSWNIYRPQLKRLESFHHKSLRSILHIHWSEHVPTTEVLKKAGLPYIETLLAHSRLKWLGHVRRMDDSRIPKQLLFGDLELGKRKQHKPRQRWKDVLRRDFKDLQKVGIDVNTKNWYGKCGPDSRSSWREIVYRGRDRLQEFLTKKQIEKRRMKKNNLTRIAAELIDWNSGQFPCRIPDCNKMFKTAPALKRHTTMMHSNRQWGKRQNQVCDLCNRNFTNQSGLKRHKCQSKMLSRSQKKWRN